jgi:hypothetical protein
MKCDATSLIFGILVLVTTPVAATDWNELSKLNDPPGRPTLKAAKVATQGMTQREIYSRWLKFSNLQKYGSHHTNGSVRDIFKREVELLEVAMEGK